MLCDGLYTIVYLRRWCETILDVVCTVAHFASIFILIHYYNYARILAILARIEMFVLRNESQLIDNKWHSSAISASFGCKILFRLCREYYVIMININEFSKYKNSNCFIVYNECCQAKARISLFPFPIDSTRFRTFNKSATHNSCICQWLSIHNSNWEQEKLSCSRLIGYPHKKQLQTATTIWKVGKIDCLTISCGWWCCRVRIFDVTSTYLCLWVCFIRVQFPFRHVGLHCIQSKLLVVFGAFIGSAINHIEWRRLFFVSTVHLLASIIYTTTMSTIRMLKTNANKSIIWLGTNTHTHMHEMYI